MSLSFHPTLSPLFLKLGKIIHAAKTLDTARGTTVPTEIEDVLDQYASGSIELQSIPDVLEAASAGFRNGGDSLMNQLAQVFRDTIIRYVKEDEQQPTDSLADAIAELIRQMEENETYVLNTTPTAVVAEVGTPTGDGGLIAAFVHDDFARTQSFAYDEVISIECVDDRTKSAETLRFRGQPAADKFAYNWPQGSGCDVSLSVVSPTDRRNLVTNGSFETDDDDDASLPDGWLKGDGTASSLVTLPVAEVQTLTTTGTPTGGSYFISWTHGTITQYTDLIPYNAGQTTVQAALRALTGLEAVTVVTTGTTPNWTHTITFTGVPKPAQLVVNDDALTGGSSPAVTPATTTAGDEAHFGGRAVKFTSDGSGTGAILYQRLTGLQASTVYALAIGHYMPTASAAGELVVDVVDDIDPAANVIPITAGVIDNFMSILSSEMNSSWSTSTIFLVMPEVLPDIAFLRIRISVAFTNTRVFYLDSIRLVPATQLYDGGPFVMAFAGSPAQSAIADQRFRLGDRFTLAVTNTYASEFQHWFNRFCDMDALGEKLPTDAGGDPSAAVNERQRLSITGTPTGGNFTLVYDGQTTTTIAYDASAATVQAALEGLSNIAAGDVSCSGGALPGTLVEITFQGNLAGQNVPLISIGTNSLTGGTTPTPSVAVFTQGVSFISDSVFIT